MLKVCFYKYELMTRAKSPKAQSQIILISFYIVVPNCISLPLLLKVKNLFTVNPSPDGLPPLTGRAGEGSLRGRRRGSLYICSSLPQFLQWAAAVVGHPPTTEEIQADAECDAHQETDAVAGNEVQLETPLIEQEPTNG